MVLGSQPAIEPLIGGGSGDKLSASVGKHLRRYFDLHGGVLPPPGLYARILKEVEMPLIEIALEATGGNQAKCAELLGNQPQYLEKKDHRSGYSRDTPPQVDVKAQQPVAEWHGLINRQRRPVRRLGGAVVLRG
jgi:DNA-binding protein Fis